MPRNPQRARQRQKSSSPAEQPASRSWLRQSPTWPVYEVLLSEKWYETPNLATVLVARQSPRSGKIAVAVFLVDLACTGVKSTFVRLCKSSDDYERRVRAPIMRDQAEDQPLEPVDFDMAAKVVLEGLGYAEHLGLSPDPEFQQARLLLAGAEPEACEEHIPLGGTGERPLYIPGPYDNMEHIISALVRTVGPEGFDMDVSQLEQENAESKDDASAP
jgi:hypothetical protein